MHQPIQVIGNTYRRDIEGSDGVLCQVLHLLQRDLDVTIRSSAIGRPILVALDLQGRITIQE